MKPKLLLKCLIIFVIVVFILNFLIVEIATWNSFYRKNVFLELANKKYKYLLIKKLVDCKNVEMYDEIAECYISISKTININAKKEIIDVDNLILFDTAFKCLETINESPITTKNLKEKHNDIKHFLALPR